MQPPQPAAQFPADVGVEGAEGLVEQQNPRFDGERAGQRPALALAAGQLRGHPVAEALELHQGQQRGHALADGRPRRPVAAAADTQTEGDVLEDAHVAEEGVVLEDEADPPRARLLPRHVLAADPDAARVGPGQSRQQAQQGRLPAAGGTQPRQQLAGRDIEADLVQDLEGAEGVGEVTYLDVHGVPRRP